MPNWCHNRVEIYGDDEELAKIKKQVETKESLFDFDTIVPMPSALKYTERSDDEDYELVMGKYVPKDEVARRRLIVEYGADNWYDWSINCWGTKWNSCDCEVEDEGDVLRYIFNTAWGPPEGVILKLRELYPDVSISAFYDEPGMEVAGYL